MLSTILNRISSSFWLPLGIFLLNFGFKLVYLDYQSIAGDEPFSIYVAGMDPSEIVKYLATGNNPPLWELILHYWIKVFGTDAFSVRFLPLVFSAFASLFIFLIGRQFFSLSVALLTSILFTFSDFHIHFSHEARVYALATFLASLSMFLFLNLLKSEEKSKFKLGFWVIANAFLVLAHYFGFWIILVQVCAATILLLDQSTRKNGLFVLMGFVFFALCCIPLLPVVINRFSESASSGTWIAEPNGLFSLVDMLRTFCNEQYGSTQFYGSKPLLTVALCLLAFVGHAKKLIRPIQKPTIIYWVIVGWFLIPFLLMWVISFKIPMFHDRYLVFASIGFIFFIATGLHAISNQRVVRNAIMSIAGLGMLFTCTPNVSNKRDVIGTISQIRLLRKQFPEALIYLCPEWYDLHFAYYWNRECFEVPATADAVKSEIQRCFANENIYPIRELTITNAQKLLTSNDVIYLDAAADFSYPNNGIKDVLASKFNQVELYEYPEIFRVYHYSRR
jgi:mannosyltransferase